MTQAHGYVPYTRGCRCPICRGAKAAYMRASRAKASRRRRLVQVDGAGRNYVEGIVHGYGGYQNHHCRCDECRAAKSAVDRGVTS